MFFLKQGVSEVHGMRRLTKTMPGSGHMEQGRLVHVPRVHIAFWLELECRVREDPSNVQLHRAPVRV